MILDPYPGSRECPFLFLIKRNRAAISFVEKQGKPGRCIFALMKHTDHMYFECVKSSLIPNNCGGGGGEGGRGRGSLIAKLNKLNLINGLSLSLITYVQLDFGKNVPTCIKSLEFELSSFRKSSLFTLMSL